MATITKVDKNGCALNLLEVDGRLFPNFPLENILSYRSLPMRDDDILLCAYPKSGTHWLWEISMMLLRGKAETITFKKSLQMLEFNSADEIAKFDSPRVLNTHVLYDALPTEAYTRKTKLILAFRNPKDVAVSFYHHELQLNEIYQYSGTFDGWLSLFNEGNVDYGSWFDYVRSWENIIYGDVTNPIHVVKYEDLKEDPLHEVQRLAEFLCVTSDPGLVGAVADKCAFAKMAVDKKPYQNTYQIMYRKGIVGDWKKYFSVADNEAFDAMYAEKMKGSRLNFRFTLKDP